jgi:CheY-like chemotaxis protein
MIPIIVVDDSREDAALASRVIVQCRILNPIRILLSGDACIKYFERGAALRDGTVPCLVLLDLSMAVTSGVDVLRRLHRAPEAQGSVFVMLSGMADYNVIREGYQLGATSFFTKPLRCEEVLRSFKSMRGITVRTVSDGHVLFPTATEAISMYSVADV